MAGKWIRIQPATVSHRGRNAAGRYHIADTREYGTRRPASNACREFQTETYQNGIFQSYGESGTICRRFYNYLFRQGNTETLVRPAVSEFLQARGLTLSEEKTKITHIDEGFDFLGFNVRKYKGTLLIKPSKKNVKEFLAKIKAIIRKNQAIRQDKLIGLLNPVITGWGNYYKGCVAAKTFKNADAQIFYKLWAWALRRHRHKGKKWVYNRYFLSKKGRAWTFGTMLKNNGKPFPYTLKYLSDIDTKTKPIKIRSKANPFDPEWRPYFEMRNRMKMLSSLKGKQGFLRMWEKQNQRCPLCGEIIDADKIWTIAELADKSGKSKIIAHDRCSRTLTRKIRAYEPVS